MWQSSEAAEEETQRQPHRNIQVNRRCGQNPRPPLNVHVQIGIGNLEGVNGIEKFELTCVNK